MKPEEMRADDNTTTTWALRYAELGLSVFPVRARTKTPFIKDWPNRATTDPARIREMWTRFPKAGIGIATGSLSGLVVIDLDTKNGQDGPENWRRYLAQQGIDLPATVTVRTRSGGRHLYYAVPEGADFRNSAGTVAEGVDVRGTGGYVVAPPTPGYTFEAGWTDDKVLPDLPPGVLPDSTATRGTAQAGERRTPAYALAAAAGGLADLTTAEIGERNDTLNRVAFSIATSVDDGLLDEELMRDTLWETAVQAGLDPEEVDKTLQSAFHAARGGTTSASGLSGPWDGPWRSSAALLWEDCDEIPVIWGPGDTPLWAEGESLMLVGPPGAGKSTLAQGLAAARIGLLDEVLGYPVKDDGGRVLYMAADRPRQIRRGLRRRFGKESDLDRLVIREGPPVLDLADPLNARWVLEQAQKVGASTVVVDSIKDVLSSPSEDGSANSYNRARQMLVSGGVNLIEIHHNRKTTTEGRGGQGGLDDVYGSRWLTAGAGSVLTLVPPRGHEDDERRTVWLRQPKALADNHRPVLLTLDTDAGLLERAEEPETLESRITGALLFGQTPMKPRDFYAELYPEGHTTSQEAYVRKTLQKMTHRGDLVRDARGRYAMTGIRGIAAQEGREMVA